MGKNMLDYPHPRHGERIGIGTRSSWPKEKDHVGTKAIDLRLRDPTVPSSPKKKKKKKTAKGSSSMHSGGGDEESSMADSVADEPGKKKQRTRLP